MCLACGFYKGRVVIDLAAKKKDREARILAKKEARSGEVAETPVATEETK
jgi:hypothetical protein